MGNTALLQHYSPSEMGSKYEKIPTLILTEREPPAIAMVFLELSPAGNRLAVSHWPRLLCSFVQFHFIPHEASQQHQLRLYFWSASIPTQATPENHSTASFALLPTPEICQTATCGTMATKQQRWRNQSPEKAQGSIKVIVNWMRATATLNIRKENEKNQQCMNWEGKVTHSQGDGVAHSIRVNNRH